MKDKIEICEWIWTELNTALSQIVKSAISAIFKVDALAQHTRIWFFNLAVCLPHSGASKNPNYSCQNGTYFALLLGVGSLRLLEAP